MYIPTGRLDALYSTRLSSTLQATIAAISDPRSSLSTERSPRSSGSPNNMMFSLQHDTGKWCTEYTWSAEDAMWGIKTLHNFGKIGTPLDVSDDPDKGPKRSSGVKRVDEEDAMEGGLKGRISAGAEFYLSAKEKSAGGEFANVCIPPNPTLYLSFTQSPPALDLQPSPTQPHHQHKYPLPPLPPLQHPIPHRPNHQRR